MQTSNNTRPFADVTSPVSRTGGRLPGMLSPLLPCALLLCGLVFAAGCRKAPVSLAKSQQHLDFNQDVQPILASNCFSCHGPDPAARKAGLRLDLEESAFKKRPGKPDAINPGHPELSEFVKRIESKDPHHLMPQSPEGEAKPMKPEEIALLKRWIAEGAHYKPHWAFDPPTRTVAAGSNAIDTLVGARLVKAGLTASPPADKPALIRRVTLDLTGLLPTPQQVAQFVADDSPQAYEHLVDRLLASPAYGEQRTRYWLDYARYADTYGLHFDNNRHIWPYRDYLIRSFNSNKPFDQFAREQIAGDLMPATTLDPIIASAYVRSGVSSNEGGTLPEELKVNIARERTEAYGAAFLGLTVGCAVCHDHKYDPTTQKDFYQLSAFFNNVDELPFNKDEPDWAPLVRIPKDQNLAAFNRVLAQRSLLEEGLRTAKLQEKQAIQHWIDSRQQIPVPVSTEKLQVRLRLDEQGGDVLKNTAPHPQPEAFPVGKNKPQWGETTWLWPDFRMETASRVDLGQAGDFEWNQPFSTGGWFMVRTVPDILTVKINGSLLSRMDTKAESRGWDLSTDQGVISVSIVNSASHLDAPPPPKPPAKPTPKPKPGAKVVEEKATIKLPEKLKPIRWPELVGSGISVSTSARVVQDNQWQHIFFTYDGSGKAAGIRIYVDGTAVATKINKDSLDRKTIRTSAPLLFGMRAPENHLARSTRYQDFQLYSRAVTPEEANRLPLENYVAELFTRPSSTWNRDQLHAVSDFFYNHVDAASVKAQEQVRQLTAQLESLSSGGDVSIVSRERPTIPYADVLSRGIYSARLERVEANTPHFLPPLPAGKPHDRLALADWTMSPENPLTARITVNRMWNEVFGTGLVETTEDFGIMGGRPSNPELLDWLAVEFRESGWDVKHMYKLLVMSNAYRQSTKSTPQQLAKDPHNLLLAHGPRFRMDAEMLRDIALQSSGLLVNKIGGPSVLPYQPPNVWESVGYPRSDTTNYIQGHGESLHRRSLYTYWKRMAMPPNMDVFDAPTRDTACTRRQRTNTPLQALVVMNDPQWIEASRVLAERVIEEGGPQPEQKLRYLGELVLSHPPPPRVEAVLHRSLLEMEQHYKSDPVAAHDLVSVGETKATTKTPAPELAAWTMVVSELLNLDETLNK